MAMWKRREGRLAALDLGFDDLVVARRRKGAKAPFGTIQVDNITASGGEGKHPHCKSGTSIFCRGGFDF